MTKTVDARGRDAYGKPGAGTIRRLATLSAALALAGMLGACSTGSDGFNDGEEKVLPDEALVRSLMAGLGAVDPKEKPIEYAPRAPLAMPSKTDEESPLPPPEDPQTAADWPTDDQTDLARVRAAYASSPLGVRLTPEQQKGLPQLAGLKERDLETEREEAAEFDGERLTPEELKQGFSKPKDDVNTTSLFGPDGKPVRRFLIDPPIEYSTPAGDGALIAPEEKKQAPLTADDWEKEARPIPLN
ncbi:hypothetical protein HPQ64_19280 [Rhizobiales bacterium]|uniref:hypothetical protein n=1 Tax=Hongsoonwoonella zoysiae TaxID=2821844 RepID=UPI0015616C1B|nr:hypothetical protein [Hongsoonwoonella zoysiae]NRG19841.1 hypothetical protein [Hongsoonwoonella zoysiae]